MNKRVNDNEKRKRKNLEWERRYVERENHAIKVNFFLYSRTLLVQPDGRHTNWERLGKKRVWPNWGTMSAVASIDWEKPRRTSHRRAHVPLKSRTGQLQNSILEQWYSAFFLFAYLQI
jgi:hypothetical protein